MNREIKFRGKRVDSDEWTYGYLVFSEDYIFDYSERIDIPYIIPVDNFNLKDYREYRVDESTIGQYTGLKDKNGKEVYEGDIFHLGDPNVTYAVVYFDTAFRGKQNGSSSCVGLEGWKDCIEVIGNIYERGVTNAKD